MRCLLALLVLLGGSAIAEDAKLRSVAEILDSHAIALGNAATVKTLSSRATAPRMSERVHTHFRLDAGLCVRAIPRKRGEYPWREYFGPEGCFVATGHFVRYRQNQFATRGAYYLFKALAEPFPLLKYVGNPAAQRGLKVGAAEDRGTKFEVLFTEPDADGVRAVYLINATTHLLENVRYEAEENKPLANLSLGDHRLVDGVMLHHATFARCELVSPDPEKKAFVLSAFSREDDIVSWEINPDLEKVRFKPPGLGRGGWKGFERTVFRTGPDPYEIAASDLDGDGKNDVVVACSGGLYVHFGGAMTAPLHVVLGKGHHRGVAVADLDCDGRVEIVTSSWLQPHDMFFAVTIGADRKPAVRRIYGAPTFPFAVQAHDLDRDGVADLVGTGWASQNVMIKFGNGLGGVRLIGSVWPLARKAEARRGLGFDIGDIDRNGLDDIVVADGTRIVILRGQVNLSFQPTIAIPAKVTEDKPWLAVDAAFADMNADGLDDVLVARSHPRDDLTEDVVVLLNTGKSFKLAGHANAAARAEAVASGHFNADDHLDVATVSLLTGEMVIVPGDGQGGLGRPEKFVSGRGSCRLAVTDFDGDGRDDVLVSNRLDDSFSIFLNRRESKKVHRATPANAVACEGPVVKPFVLKGLTDDYTFEGEFRLPVGIRDPSGIACLGGDLVHAQFMIVSDKRSAMFRAILDRSGRRLLVGPEIPLHGLGGARLDLEGVAWDHGSGNLFLGCEADSSVVRANIFGHVLGRVPTGIALGSDGNDGIEGLAVRRLKDDTPLLYVFKERHGKTLRVPGAHVFALLEDPFRLELRQKDIKVPQLIPDQSGATIMGDRAYVVSRFTRAIVETGFKDDVFAGDAKVASFGKLTDDLLGLVSPKTPRYGNVEGITLDWHGNLFLLVDNNGERIGRKGLNRGREGRVLWFKAKGKLIRRIPPRQVRVRGILVPWKDKAQAAAQRKLAVALLAEARAGAALAVLATGHGLDEPTGQTIVQNAVAKPPKGARRLVDVASGPGLLSFNLEVGEFGLCEYDAHASPQGWWIIVREE